jgi:hypothetical protein
MTNRLRSQLDESSVAGQRIQRLLGYLLQTPWLAYRGAEGRLFSKFGNDDMPDFSSAIPTTPTRT